MKNRVVLAVDAIVTLDRDHLEPPLHATASADRHAQPIILLANLY